METHEDTRSADIESLRGILRRMALAGSAQPPLFPEDREEDAGALASAFDRCAAVLLGSGAPGLGVEASDAVAAVRHKLATMSSDGAEFDADLWTHAALQTSEHWADVRRLAASALEALSRSVRL